MIFWALPILVLSFVLGNSSQNPLRKRLSAQELQLRYGDALDAIFGVGVRLQALLEDPNTKDTNNFLVSPLSVSLLIAQMMLGAEGKFQDDLYNLLSLPTGSEHKNTFIHYFNKKKNSTYTLPYAKLHLQLGNLVKAMEGNEISRAFALNSTNAVFVNKDLQIKDEFLQHLKIYDTDLQKLDFKNDPIGAQKIINDWASAQTNGVIKKILQEPLPATASGLFSNAIYFKAEWETPFSYEMNVKAPFLVSKDSTVQAEFMRGFLENIYYGESSKLGCKMMALPYKNNELSMYFMLPFEGHEEEFNIKKFAEKLQAKDVLEFIDSMKPYSVTLQIPKLQLSNSLSILEPLQKYALYMKHFRNKSADGDSLDTLNRRIDAFTRFNSSEDVSLVLSEVAVGQGFTIGDILQEVTLSVDEKGTEAAAVTAGILDYIGGSKNFRVDKPFLFFIRHEPTSATLFWGTIVDPTRSQ